MKIPATIDPFQYLKDRRLKHIRRIERLAERGTKEDMVRLQALKTLLGKTMADMTKVEIESEGKSPYEKLLEACKEDDKNAKGDTGSKVCKTRSGAGEE